MHLQRIHDVAMLQIAVRYAEAIAILKATHVSVNYQVHMKTAGETQRAVIRFDNEFHPNFCVDFL